jgi:zeaxanthin glucosyltransferase
VLDSLAAGVPMVTIPITYEQPAIARRVERVGCGVALSLSGLQAHLVQKAVTRIRRESAFVTAASRLRDAMPSAAGAIPAAEIITMGRPQSSVRTHS